MLLFPPHSRSPDARGILVGSGPVKVDRAQESRQRLLHRTKVILWDAVRCADPLDREVDAVCTVAVRRSLWLVSGMRLPPSNGFNSAEPIRVYHSRGVCSGKRVRLRETVKKTIVVAERRHLITYCRIKLEVAQVDEWTVDPFVDLG